MKITTTKAPGGGFVTLLLEHGADSFSINYTTFARTTINDHDKLFSITNSILGKLSEEAQGLVFDIYREVDAIASQQSMDLGLLIERVASLTNDLYSILKLTSVNADGELSLSPSLLFRSEFYIPDSLQTEYTGNHKRETTYLRDDYIGLCGLSEAMRFALPIWISFMRARQDEVGTEFKEHIAASLIYGTDVYKTAQSNRLATYIDAIIGPTRLPLAAIHAGLADSESGEYMTALALIRKISIGETQIKDVDLICNVSNYARKLLSQLAKRFDSSGRVVETPQPSETSGDDNTSTAESPRLKEKLPISRFEEMKAFIRKYPERIVEMITGRCPPKTLLASVRAAVNRLDSDAVSHPARLRVMLMVVRRSLIPATLSENLDTEYRRKLLTIAAVAVHLNEEYLIYHLLTAHLKLNDNMALMGGQLNSAISVNSLLELNKLYYMDDPDKSNAQTRRANLAHQAIVKILDELSDYDMEANLPAAYSQAGETIERSAPYGEALVKVMIDYDYKDPYAQEDKLASLASQALTKLKNQPTH